MIIDDPQKVLEFVGQVSRERYNEGFENALDISIRTMDVIISISGDKEIKLSEVKSLLQSFKGKCSQLNIE